MATKGERLKAARERAGFKSAKAAADHFGWPESTYRAHEKAEHPDPNVASRNYRLEDAQKYAAAYGTTAEHLFYGDTAGRQKVVHRGHSTLTTPPNLMPRPGTIALSSKRLEVLGQAIGGVDGRFLMNGEVVDYVMCPPGLENAPGAYAVYVVGESMEPRYMAGETVFVHPNKPYRKGDYVVVQLHDVDNPDGPPLGYIKRFVAVTPTRLILSQFNPNKELEFERRSVVSIHKIVLAGES